jgi:hypothetical protein
MNPKHRDYCQFLIITQTNYTQTYFADHHPEFSHDSINRHLRDSLVSSSMVWSQIKDDIVYSANGYLVFDDSVSDKRYSTKIELVRRQYSGNEHAVIKGIGVVNCLYVNPDTGEYWVIDWRVYNIDADGKSKLDHVREMLDNAIAHKKLPFRTVLMDSWYATKKLMLHIDKAGKIFYCPLKSNRKVDDSGGTKPYQAVSELSWTSQEMDQGKLIKINEFPGDYKVKLFRVVVNSDRTDWVVTNDLSQASTSDTKKKCAVRWKIEQYHREVKQTLGIEKCQCRLARAQKNHIGYAILAWNHLTTLARKMGTNIYALKENLLSEYMREELKNPSIAMAWR